MPDPVAAFSRGASRVALAVSVAGLVVMTGIIMFQVIARMIGGLSASWTEQAALLLMLWFILFAGAVGVREGFHIRITALQEALSVKSARGLRVVCHGVVLVFGAAMAANGAVLAIETWSHVIPALGLPRGVAYLPLAGAGALIAFFAGEHIAAELTNREVRPLWS